MSHCSFSVEVEGVQASGSAGQLALSEVLLCMFLFLFFKGRVGVIFGGGFGTLNSVGIACLVSLFFLSAFVNCEFSK